MPTSFMDYAQLSLASHNQTEPTNWTMGSIQGFGSFSVTPYQRNDTLVIACNGPLPTGSLVDWWNSVIAGYQALRSSIIEIINDHPHTSIATTGFQLGGVMAIVINAEFGAPAVVFHTPGASEILEALSLSAAPLSVKRLSNHVADDVEQLGTSVGEQIFLHPVNPFAVGLARMQTTIGEFDPDTGKPRVFSEVATNGRLTFVVRHSNHRVNDTAATPSDWHITGTAIIDAHNYNAYNVLVGSSVFLGGTLGANVTVVNTTMGNIPLNGVAFVDGSYFNMPEMPVTTYINGALPGPVNISIATTSPTHVALAHMNQCGITVVDRPMQVGDYSSPHAGYRPQLALTQQRHVLIPDALESTIYNLPLDDDSSVSNFSWPHIDVDMSVHSAGQLMLAYPVADDLSLAVVDVWGNPLQNTTIANSDTYIAGSLHLEYLGNNTALFWKTSGHGGFPITHVLTLTTNLQIINHFTRNAWASLSGSIRVAIAEQLQRLLWGQTDLIGGIFTGVHAAMLGVQGEHISDLVVNDNVLFKEILGIGSTETTIVLAVKIFGIPYARHYDPNGNYLGISVAVPTNVNANYPVHIKALAHGHYAIFYVDNSRQLHMLIYNEEHAEILSTALSDQLISNHMADIDIVQLGNADPFVVFGVSVGAQEAIFSLRIWNSAQLEIVFPHAGNPPEINPPPPITISLPPTPSATPSLTLTMTPTGSLTLTLTPTPSPFVHSASPTPTPSHSPTPSITFTLTPTPSKSSSLTPSMTFTVTPTPTPSHSMTPSMTFTLTSTPSKSGSLTPSMTFTVTPTPTPSHSMTPSMTFTLTSTPSKSGSLTPSMTFTVTPTPTPSHSMTPSMTFTLTSTPSKSGSLTPSMTFTVTPTPTPSHSMTPSMTFTLTSTPSKSGSLTPSMTFTVTPTPTPSHSMTPSMTFTLTSTPSKSGSLTPSMTFTVTPTPTPSHSMTPSMTFTLTSTPSKSGSLTPSMTFTVTPSPTPSHSMTPSMTFTLTSTPSKSGSLTPSMTFTVTPTPTPSHSMTPSMTFTLTSTPSKSGSLTPSMTFTVTPTPTPSHSMTPSMTFTLTSTPSKSGSLTPSMTFTVTPTPTPSHSMTPSMTFTLTSTPSKSGSLTPSMTFTVTPTPTPSHSMTPSMTFTLTSTPSKSGSLTPSMTFTVTPSPTPSHSMTPSMTFTLTSTPSKSGSLTPSMTFTVTPTPTPSHSMTPSMTFTLTSTPSKSGSLTPSMTFTVTPTPTPSHAMTPSMTFTLTSTPSKSGSLTPSLSVTPTNTGELTVSLTGTATPTPTFTFTPTSSGAVTLTMQATPSDIPVVIPVPSPSPGDSNSLNLKLIIGVSATGAAVIALAAVVAGRKKIFWCNTPGDIDNILDDNDDVELGRGNGNPPHDPRLLPPPPDFLPRPPCLPNPHRDAEQGMLEMANMPMDPQLPVLVLRPDPMRHRQRQRSHSLPPPVLVLRPPLTKKRSAPILVLRGHHNHHHEADDLEALFARLRDEDIANNAPARIAALEAIIAHLRTGEKLSQEQISALLAELNMELQDIDSGEEDDIPPYVPALTEAQIQAILAGELPERRRRNSALELLATSLQLVDQPAARLAELLPRQAAHEIPNNLARLFQQLSDAQDQIGRNAALEAILTWLQAHDDESTLPLNTAQVKLLLGLLGIDPQNISDAEDISVAFQLIREELDENGSSEFEHRELILSIIYTSAAQKELSAAELVYKAIRQGSKVPPLVLNSQQQTHQVHQVHDPDELNTLFQILQQQANNGHHSDNERFDSDADTDSDNLDVVVADDIIPEYMRALSDEEMMAALLGMPLLSAGNQFLVNILAGEAQQAGLPLVSYLRQLHAQREENQRLQPESDSSSSRTPPQTFRERQQAEEIKALEEELAAERRQPRLSLAHLEASYHEHESLPEFIQRDYFRYVSAQLTQRNNGEGLTPRQWVQARVPSLSDHVDQFTALSPEERREYNRNTQGSRIEDSVITPRQFTRKKQQKEEEEEEEEEEKKKEKKVSRSSVGSLLAQHHQYVPTILTGGRRQIRRTNSASSQHIQQRPRTRAIRDDNALEQIREDDSQSSSVSPSISIISMPSMSPMPKIMPQPSVVPSISVLPVTKPSYSKHTHRETPKPTFNSMPHWLKNPHDPRNFNTWGANAALVAVASHWVSQARQWLFSRRMPIMFSDTRWFDTLLSATQLLQIAIRDYQPNDCTAFIPLCQQLELCVSSISQQPLILEDSMHPTKRLGLARQQLASYLAEQSLPFSHLDDDAMTRLSQKLKEIDHIIAEEWSLLLLDELADLRDQLLETPYPNALTLYSAEIIMLFGEIDQCVAADDEILATLLKISRCDYLATLKQHINQLQSNLAAALLLARQMDFPAFPYDSKDVMYFAQETLPKKSLKQFLRQHKATAAYQQMQAEDISVFILINDIASPKPSLSLVRQLLNKLAQLNKNIRYSPVVLTPSNKEKFRYISLEIYSILDLLDHADQLPPKPQWEKIRRTTIVNTLTALQEQLGQCADKVAQAGSATSAFPHLDADTLAFIEKRLAALNEYLDNRNLSPIQAAHPLGQCQFTLWAPPMKNISQATTPPILPSPTPTPSLLQGKG